MRKRIAILCSDAVVVEPATSQRRRLRLRRQYKNYAYSLYHHLRRTVLGLNAYRRKYFADCANNSTGATPRRLVVDFINDPLVVKLLREISPEITIVICTSILGHEVLNAAGTAINVHGGFLPYYRGNHCFFFALYNEDFDKIGSTIHFVDAGIDTDVRRRDEYRRRRET